VLIVEDERIVAKDLQETLAGMGYDAFAIASSADEAVSEASKRRPDVVLMDIRIKGALDGIDAAEILRQRYGIPIVYLTAYADEATLERAKKTEPYSYLLKPVKAAELRRVMELALYKHAAESRAETPPRPPGATPVTRATRRIAVLLADDHAIVREGLVSLLKEHDFDVVAAVGDGHELLDSAKRLRPDVIVTDISMPGLSGLDVLARLKTERVDSKVIVLTMHDDADLATRATRAGASGFLIKHSAGEELVNAIHQVLQGRTYLTPALTKGVMERLAAPASQSEPQLTPRQREVLRLIVEGQRMKEIAATLDLSTRTVETHKYELMRVLDLHSTAELVRYAIQHRLIGN
jgi:DNA-binding NarL/FixJ family response regulator